MPQRLFMELGTPGTGTLGCFYSFSNNGCLVIHDRRHFRSLVFALVLSAAGSLFAHAAAVNPVQSFAGKPLPEEIVFHEDGKDYTLRLTGASLRKKFIFKIYSVAHYMEKNAVETSILTDGAAKQIFIRYLRDIPGKKIRIEILQYFILNSTPEEYREMQPLTEKLLSFFSEAVHNNDELVIRWLPGGKIKVYLNAEEKGVVTNATFARVLWSIWFGQNTLINSAALTDKLR